MKGKFGQAHVWIIGGVLMLIIGGLGYYLLIRPVDLDITKVEGEVNTIKQTSKSVDGATFNNSQVDVANKKLEEQQKRVDTRKSELAVLERTKQLPPSQVLDVRTKKLDKIVHTLPRWLDLPRNVVTLVERWSKTHARRHKIELLTSFAAPAPGTNVDNIPTQIVPWQLGGMQFTGKFNDVMAWYRGWNNAPLVCKLDGLRLTLAGRGGKVTGTAVLTAFVFPTGEAVTIPSGGGGGGAGGAVDPFAAAGAGGAMGGPGDPTLGGAGPAGAMSAGDIGGMAPPVGGMGGAPTK